MSHIDVFFFSSRRRHTRSKRDWSSDVCSSDLAPDDAPQRLAHLASIEACHSVAGEESYILKVRVPSPAVLEDLLQQIRAAAGVSTRTTIVLSTPDENRPPD